MLLKGNMYIEFYCTSFRCIYAIFYKIHYKTKKHCIYINMLIGIYFLQALFDNLHIVLSKNIL
ncbi:hypothetical protein SAMN02745728_01258 [Desulfovibrio litoralis DSM 11393]|uniref:Uncharacterized protein n=1 Tax=Desulfovibrio litoralis DSM 11393 TaxID=1121455 RepID=A0A1M7STK4_9BACT|nr:hypothetical protein SAMN02745728_01258 [Desulfovibrio litoralis DSM 11393]